jgi:hypothetical protein
MVKVQSFPYLRPAHHHIVVVEWQQISDDGTGTSLPESLPHWDPGTAITVRATVDLNVVQIWQECMLSDEDQLRLAILWDSLGTGLRGRGNVITLPKNYPVRIVEMQARIEGVQLANQIRFIIHLILARPGKSISKLAPHIPGCILWQEERTLMLEGQGPRFPMEFLHFSSSSNPLPAGAGWYLEWNPEAFEESFMGRVRLFLNEDNRLIARSVKGHAQEDLLIQGMLRFDIGKTMIIAALSSDSFLENYRSYEDGSIGATIRNMLNTYFPAETIEGLANYYRNSSARFECALQEHFQLFQFTEEG